MYSLYSDGKLIYSPTAATDGFVLTGEARYTEEMNSPGSMTFAMPVINPNYSEVRLMQSEITVKRDDGKVVWRGRPVDISRDFYNTKTVTCESELAYLYDILFSKWRRVAAQTKKAPVKEYFMSVMNFYNTQCQNKRSFILAEDAFDPRADYGDDELTFDTSPYDWPTVYDVLINDIANVYGGFLKVVYGTARSELRYMAVPDKSRNKKIVFGKNMLDLSESIDYTDIYTRLYAYGATVDGTQKRVSLSTNSNPQIYIDASDDMIRKYGIIERLMTFNDITNAGTLRKMAQRCLDEATAMPSSLTVKASDLSDGEAYEGYEVGESVGVDSAPHGLKENFICTAVKVNIVDPSKTEYTFGLVSESLTDRVVGAMKKTDKAITDVFNLKHGIDQE